jgi:hypothetical protein
MVVPYSSVDCVVGRRSPDAPESISANDERSDDPFAIVSNPRPQDALGLSRAGGRNLCDRSSELRVVSVSAVRYREEGHMKEVNKMVRR